MKNLINNKALIGTLLSIQLVLVGCSKIRSVAEESEALSSLKNSIISVSSKLINQDLRHLSVAEQSYGTSNSKNMYAQISGYKGWGTTANDLYIFDGKSWDHAGEATVDHLDTTIAFSSDDSTVMIAGGKSDLNDELKRVDLFHIKDKKFERVADLNYPRQENITVTSSEGDFVTIGGKFYDRTIWKYVNYKNFEVYNAELDEWTVYPLLYKRGEEFSAVSTPIGILIIGGKDSTAFDDSGTAVGGAVELITKQSNGTYASKKINNLKIDRDSPYVEVVTLNAQNYSKFGKIGDVIAFAFSGYGMNVTEMADKEGLTYEYINLSKTNDVWRYGTTYLPFDRWDSYGFTMNNKIHMFGGWVSEDGTYKDIIFDIKTGAFTSTDTLGVDGGMGGAGMVITPEGDEVGVALMGWGNFNDENSSIAPTIYLSNLTNYLWSNAPSDSTLGHAYDGASVQLSSTQVMTCGGFLSGELISTDECKIFDSSTGKITPTGRLNHARSEFTIAKNPKTETIFAVGGTNKWKETSIVEEYDAVKGSWSEKVDMKYGMRRPIVNFEKNGNIYIDGAELWSFSYNTFKLSSDLMTASTPTDPMYVSWNAPQFYVPLTKESGSVLFLGSGSSEMALVNGLATMLVDSNANSQYWYEGTPALITKYEGSSAALLANGGLAMFGASSYTNSSYCSSNYGTKEAYIAGTECSSDTKIDKPANMLYYTYGSPGHDAGSLAKVSDPENSSFFPTIISMKDGSILTLGGGTYLDYYKKVSFGIKSEWSSVAVERLGGLSDITWTHHAKELMQSYNPKTDTWTTFDSKGTDFFYPTVGVLDDTTLVYGSFYGIDYVSGNLGLAISETMPIDQRVRYLNQTAVKVGTQN